MRRTILSVYHNNNMLFNTDSFPAIPEVGEVISVRSDDLSARYVVESREFIYQSYTSNKDREIFVVINVRKHQ